MHYFLYNFLYFPGFRQVDDFIRYKKRSSNMMSFEKVQARSGKSGAGASEWGLVIEKNPRICVANRRIFYTTQLSLHPTHFSHGSA
jgi:hypothetical protein